MACSVLIKKRNYPFVILKPSKIQGVGCFTSEPIRKGERIKLLDSRDCKFVKRNHVSKEEKWKYDTWCVETNGGWWCPLNFQRMSIGWYINHSITPNLSSLDDGITFIAVRYIKIGEELTVNYKDLDTDFDNDI